MKRTISQLLLGTAMAAFISNSFAIASRHNWDFKVYLDGDVIGTHNFSSYTKDDKRYIDIKANFNVNFLFFNAYHYVHDNQEVWLGDCLQSIHSQTDDNGKHEFVKGSLEHGALELQTNKNKESLQGCIRTFAYWDPNILNSDKLLNAQTGELLPVKVKSLGSDTIKVRGEMVKSSHYRLVTPKFSIDLWYSPKREWLALKSKTESGAVLRYQLQ